MRWLFGLALLMLLLGVLWLGWHGMSFARYALSAQQAGQLISQGLTWPEPRYSYSLPTVRDHDALERALPALTRVHQLQPESPWPLWQMARVYTAQEAWQDAIDAFARARAVEPENPLLAWEEGLLHFELLNRIGPSEPSPITEQIAAGELTTPDTIVGTPYCAQGSCYSGLTTITQPLAGEPNQEPITAPFLFLHPPAQIATDFHLPVWPAMMTFLLGLDPYAADFGTDGAEFELTVQPEEGAETSFTFAVDAETLRAGWTAVSVDLSPWAGQRVQLTFSTTPGPSGKNGGDWVGWGAISLDRVSVGGSQEELKQQVRSSWEDAGIRANSLLVRAERARTSQEFERASRWYQAAITFADVGESGLNHMAWAQSQADGSEPNEQLLVAAISQDAGWSSPQQRIEAWTVWGRQREAEGDLAAARDAYRVVVDTYDLLEGSESAQAGAYQRLGDIQRTLGENQAAVESFEAAVALMPESEWSHLGLGRSLLALPSPDLRAVEHAFDAARAVAPDDEQLLRTILESWRAAGAQEQVATLCAELDPSLWTEEVSSLCAP